MADDRPTPQRRTPASYQPIEPVDEGTGTGTQPRQALVPPLPPSPGGALSTSGASTGAATPAPVREEPESGPPFSVPVRDIAVRFASSAAALAFAGQLLSIGRGDGLTFAAQDDYARWVRGSAELDIVRELAEAAHGLVFVAVEPGRLVEDHGWGTPPAAEGPATAVGETVDASTLVPVDLTELIRAAGLHEVRERPVSVVHLLLPGTLLGGIVRRALDLRLDVAHRPVRLWPLLPLGDTRDSPAALLEVRLSAADGHLPASLLDSLARNPQLTLCRPDGDVGNLLIRYGRATPLRDDLLAGFIDDEAWVLTDGPLGCQLLNSVGEFTESVGAVRVADGYPLVSATPPSDDQPSAPELRVVPMRTYGRGVDAILLTDADLGALALLIEGHPLSERAQLVRGRDRHLLVVPGGILDNLPVGDALYQLGPGPLYLPLGHGISPGLPPSARRALFGVDEKTALVLLPTLMLKFSVTEREPVWTLWAGPLPEVDLQLPADAVGALASVAASPPETARQRRERVTTDKSLRTWLDDALEAEFRGELTAAAELHERHGDPVRAARLWARAAGEAS